LALDYTGESTWLAAAAQQPAATAAVTAAIVAATVTRLNKLASGSSRIAAPREAPGRGAALYICTGLATLHAVQLEAYASAAAARRARAMRRRRARARRRAAANRAAGAGRSQGNSAPAERLDPASGFIRHFGFMQRKSEPQQAGESGSGRHSGSSHCTQHSTQSQHSCAYAVRPCFHLSCFSRRSRFLRGGMVRCKAVGPCGSATAGSWYRDPFFGQVRNLENYVRLRNIATYSNA
jgi:hypothetical protein